MVDTAPMLTVKPAALTTIATPALTPLPMPEVLAGTAALIENNDGQSLAVGGACPGEQVAQRCPLRRRL